MNFSDNISSVYPSACENAKIMNSYRSYDSYKEYKIFIEFMRLINACLRACTWAFTFCSTQVHRDWYYTSVYVLALYHIYWHVGIVQSKRGTYGCSCRLVTFTMPYNCESQYKPNHKKLDWFKVSVIKTHCTCIHIHASLYIVGFVLHIYTCYTIALDTLNWLRIVTFT